MRGVMIRLGTLAFGLAAGLLVGEAGVRLLHFEKETFWQPHELYGWSHIPGRTGRWFSKEFDVRVRINARGLRQREMPYEKPAGTRRILVLGDSMTEGLQVPVEATFSSRLESTLNETGSGLFEVVNTGVSHFGTSNELLYFRHEGYKYVPDVVLLAFLTTNDVMNNSHELGRGSPYFELGKGNEIELKDFPLPPTTSRLQRMRSYLGQQSHTYRLISRATRERMPDVTTLLQKAGVFTKHSPGVPGQTEIPTDFFIYARDYDVAWTRAWETTRQLILTLKREVEGRGAKFVVVVMSPQFVRARPENWEEWVDAIPAMRGRAWDVGKPDRLMEELLNREGIPYLQTLGAFGHQARAGHTLYFAADGHFNENGHGLAARLIQEKLVELGLISAPLVSRLRDSQTKSGALGEE